MAYQIFTDATADANEALIGGAYRPWDAALIFWGTNR